MKYKRPTKNKLPSSLAKEMGAIRKKIYVDHAFSVNGKGHVLFLWEFPNGSVFTDAQSTPGWKERTWFGAPVEFNPSTDRNHSLMVMQHCFELGLIVFTSMYAEDEAYFAYKELWEYNRKGKK